MNYLVIGVYKAATNQRYAAEVKADNPAQAEALAQEQCYRENRDDEDEDADAEFLYESLLIIAGVLKGRNDEETSAIEVMA